MPVKQLSDKTMIIVPEYPIWYDEVRLRICALIDLLIAASDQGDLSQEMVYYTCRMITDLLPSMEEFEALGRAVNEAGKQAQPCNMHP